MPWRTWLLDIGVAIVFLTRFPVDLRQLRAGLGMNPDEKLPHLARSMWAFPLVGMLIGAIGALAYQVFWHLTEAPLLAAFWAVGAMAVMTGALHEDGLADTVDGFGGGRTRERRLEIMRDSRIGSYGTLALLLTVGVRVAAVAAIGDPADVAGALIAAAALGRGCGLGLSLLTRPARTDGLAAAAGQPMPAVLLAGMALAVLPVLLLDVDGRGPWAIVACAAWVGLLAMITRRLIGGHTGDVLGAAEQMGECIVLTLLVLP